MLVTYRDHRDNLKSIAVIEWITDTSFLATDSRGRLRRYWITNNGKLQTVARTVRGHRGYTLGYFEARS